MELSDAISNLNACPLWGAPSIPPMPPCSGTHVGIGIESAIDQLDTYAPADGIIGQAIVIVGDGKAQITPRGAQGREAFYGESDYYSICGGNCSNAELAQMANLAADEAGEKGYDIFVVFYDEDNDDVAAEFFEGLVRGAGRFYRTPNSQDLPDLVPEMCVRLADLRLVM